MATKVPEIYDRSFAAFSAKFSAELASESHLLAIPMKLQSSSERRRSEFIAGRLCAQNAFRKITGLSVAPVIGRSASGAPVWPLGFVGSLTHAGEFAAAVIARAESVRSIGIDSERILTAESASEIASTVCTPRELESLSGMLELERLVSLIFSVKESIYKCLYPSVGRLFDFKDVELTRLDLGAGGFRAVVLTKLHDAVDAGFELNGGFEFGNEFVHTLVVLPRNELRQRLLAKSL